MNTLESFLKDVFTLLGVMIKGTFKLLTKLLIFVLWVICGIIVLPCVFVAGNLYPKWTEWGEKL